MTIATFSKELEEHYKLEDLQIREFRRQGYIKLKNVFSPEVLEYYGEAITRVTMAKNPLASIPLELRDTYGKAFIQVGNIWQQDETAREFTFSKRLARIAAELLEVDSVRLWHDQALYKESGGGITPWHVDQQYWPMLTD